MQNYYDYQKYAILYVDDEEHSLKYIKRYYASKFRFLIAPNAAEGYKILEEQHAEIAILMSDQRMPGEKGVQLLEKSRQNFPHILRILATAFTDIDAAVAAVNSGAIYKYMSKPFDLKLLEMTLLRGIEFFVVQRERDQLLREKLTVLHNLMITDRIISLGILAAGLGHYVRNSLVAVQTFLDLAPVKLGQEIAVEKMRNPNFWKDFYTHVQDQVRRITGMLDDLGTTAERPTMNYEAQVELPTVIKEVLEKSEHPLAAKHITVDNQIPAALPALTVDRMKFYRLFELLLEDDIACLPEGGQITLRAKALPPDDQNETRLQIEVEDNGPGLPQEALRAVFDPFFLRADDPQHFGISLMACYFIVYHHGGTIKVKSRDGQGTTFVITLPLRPQTRYIAPNERDFLVQVLLNDNLWEKLLATA
jgi:two-component system probable response regulator PhcQ